MTDETPVAAPVEPILTVVRGNPSDEELAVVIALFAAAGQGAAPTPAPTVGGWADRRALLRPAVSHGSGAWAASARTR